ncbi:MAG: DUF4097 domain-containing protein [Oscillospiraceae bacterium]|nr:DUF4097 domain-containing protein [Oscillospiraceae bacterium]
MRKVILIIAACLVLLGAAVAIIAFTLGANTSIYWDRGFHIDRGGSAGTDLDEALSPFNRIDLSAGVANVTIRPGDGYRLEGHYHGTLTHEVRDGRLILDLRERSGRSWFNIGTRGGSRTSHLILTIPADTVLEGELNLGVGTVRTQQVDLYNVTITSGVGDIHVDGALGGINRIESGVGNVYVDGSLTGRSRIESGVGNVEITAHGGAREQVSYTISAGVGNITIDGTRQGGALGNSLSHTAADPLVTLQLESGVGNVVLNFRG